MAWLRTQLASLTEMLLHGGGRVWTSLIGCWEVQPGDINARRAVRVRAS